MNIIGQTLELSMAVVVSAGQIICSTDIFFNMLGHGFELKFLFDMVTKQLLSKVKAFSPSGAFMILNKL